MMLNTHSGYCGPFARRGLSLVELLCALTILSAFVVAATSWMTSTAKAQTAIEQTLDKQIMLQRIVVLLRADLDNALPSTVTPVLATGRLSMITADSADQGAPGWRRIRWYLDPNSGELIRSSQRSDSANPTKRVIAWGVQRFEMEVIAISNTTQNAASWAVFRTELDLDGHTAHLFWERPG